MPIITTEWDKVLANKLTKPLMDKIQGRLKSDIDNRNVVVPQIKNIFRAYKETEYKDVKVLILGQDPFFSKDRADGLAFSSEYMTPSMDTIIKEIKGSTGKVRTKLTLDDWASQGVMLLNTSLTTLQGKAGAHIDLWSELTKYTVMRLNDRKEPFVAMLWGTHAIEFGKLINPAKHFILKAPHPASDSYGDKPWNAKTFRGCGHFEQANDWLQSKGLKQINWGDPHEK